MGLKIYFFLLFFMGNKLTKNINYFLILIDEEKVKKSEFLSVHIISKKTKSKKLIASKLKEISKNSGS